MKEMIERKDAEKKRRAQFWACDGAPQGVTSCGGRVLSAAPSSLTSP